MVGEKFRELIATLDIPVHPDRTIRLTVSIGVCAAHARGLANVEAVVTGAEEALAQASRGGGNVTEVTELSESGEKVS